MRRDEAASRSVLEAVAGLLEDLLPEVVFVGGHVAGLLVTTPVLRRFRATLDVDLLVRVTTRAEYRAMESRLRRLGLASDTRPGAPICRWIAPGGILIDVMPESPDVLGFSNRWYPAILDEAVPYPLGPRIIRIPPAPLYVASKWEALQERGRLDLLASHDLEDIITVVAGRPELQDEVRSAPAGLRAYLGEQARALLGHPDFSTALAGALPEARDLRGLLEVVTGRFRGMAAPFSRT